MKKCKIKFFEEKKLVEAKRIRKRLIDLDMTQRELANKVGIKESYLGDILAGRKCKSAGTKYADKIYEVLGIKRVS